jgi:hypothetical protein
MPHLHKSRIFAFGHELPGGEVVLIFPRIAASKVANDSDVLPEINVHFFQILVELSRAYRGFLFVNMLRNMFLQVFTRVQHSVAIHPWTPSFT